MTADTSRWTKRLFPPTAQVVTRTHILSQLILIQWNVSKLQTAALYTQKLEDIREKWLKCYSKQYKMVCFHLFGYFFKSAKYIFFFHYCVHIIYILILCMWRFLHRFSDFFNLIIYIYIYTIYILFYSLNFYCLNLRHSNCEVPFLWTIFMVAIYKLKAKLFFKNKLTLYIYVYYPLKNQLYKLLKSVRWQKISCVLW